jgi:hypothetical protein
VKCRKASSPATAIAVCEAREFDWLGGSINSRINTERHFIQASLIGSNKCTAEGITAYGPAPILKLCRELIKAGFHPGRPLHAYRGDVLCIVARTIGEAAGIDINGHGTGFIKRPEQGGTAPPMRQPEIWGTMIPRQRLENRRASEPIHPLELFYARAFEMAQRIDAGYVGFIDGVDLLYSAAEWAGLIEKYGDDEVQSALSQAFIDASMGVYRGPKCTA